MSSVLISHALFAELSLRGWFPSSLFCWLAVVLGILAVGLVGFLYARESGRMQFLLRMVMASVRVAIVVLVALLIFRPVWVKEEKGERRRPVALMIDVSQSMDSMDPRPSTADQWRVAIAYDLVPPDKGISNDLSSSPLPADARLPDRPKRIDVVRAAFENKRLNLFESLRKLSGPLDLSTFGSRRLGREGDDASWLRDLKASEPRTALADAVAELVGRDENDLPAAVILVTDGRENASRVSLDELARECARLQIPVHVYGVGSSAFGQVQLRDVAVPETVFVDDSVPVSVRYRVKGVVDGRAEILLRYDDREVGRKVIEQVRDGDDLREIINFTPIKKDSEAKKAELTITVRVANGTDTLVDEVTKPVKVVDKKLKVLVVDSIPRFDFKFLQQSLLRDRRVDARFYLTEGDRSAMKSGKPWVQAFSAGRDEFRKEIFEYDLLILGDIPAKFWSVEQQEVVRDFVAEGGGLIHMAGPWHAPAGWVKTPIAEVLPVEFEAVRFPIESPQRASSFRPQVVASAARSPILSLEDDQFENTRRWRTLPEMFWSYPVTRLKPAAEAFLIHPSKKLADGKPMPLLAGHYYGKGYVLFAGFEETWRWRFNEGDKYFGRFWSQAVYVAGVPRTVGTKLTQLSLDTSDPVQGKVGQVYARLFTKDFQPVAAEEIEARLVKLDAEPNDRDANTVVRLVAVRSSDNRPTGEYVATLPFNRTGRFSLKVDANNGNPANLDYRVTLPPEHELAPGGMAEADMRKLADNTGGKFLREEDLATLAEQVKPRFVPYTTRSETILWNRWTMAVLIALLSLEWVVRKFNGLS